MMAERGRSARAAIAGALIACAGIRAATGSAPQAEILFEGLRSIRESALRAAVEPWLEDLLPEVVDPTAAEDLAWFVEEHCRGEGYLDVRVEGRIERRADGVAVVLRIDEGMRFFVRSLRISGNRAVADSPIRLCFPWKRAGWFGAGSAVFSQEALQKGLEGIRAYYRSLGFREVRVAADPPAIDRTRGRVDLVVRIEEGRRAILRELRIRGVDPAREREIRAKLGVLPPVPLGTDLTASLAGRTREILREEGHLFAELDAELSIDERSAEAILTLSVREGPQARIDRIDLRGLEKVKPSVARRTIPLREGDIARQDRIDEAHRKLLRRGLFRGARIDVEKLDPEGERVALAVGLEEAPRYELHALAGVGSYELLRVGAGAENRNLWGLGHRLRAGGKVSFVDERADLEYGIPWIRGSDISGRGRIYLLDRREPSFTRREGGAEILFDASLFAGLSGEAGYAIRSSGADPDERAEKNTLRIASILGRLAYDARDDIVEPRRGAIADLSAEYGDTFLGSEVAFLRFTGRATWVFSFADRWTFLPSFRAGLAFPIEGESEVPIQLRFFNGGENTVRSFREGRLGPRNERGKFVGGEGFIAMTVEQRFPIWRDLGGAIFADAGHAAPRISRLFTERLHFGIGAGLRYRTPFGPARLDAAVNPAPVRGKDTWAVHFGLGYPF